MILLRVIALLLLAFLYLRSPIDLLPDRFFPLGVIDDLIVVGATIWWIRRQLRGARPARGERPEAPPSSPRGPYEILGVPYNASRDEITRAYREQMKLYHPDRVADLGEELKHLAHEKAIEIQKAYEQLSDR